LSLTELTSAAKTDIGYKVHAGSDRLPPFVHRGAIPRRSCSSTNSGSSRRRRGDMSEELASSDRKGSSSGILVELGNLNKGCREFLVFLLGNFQGKIGLESTDRRIRFWLRRKVFQTLLSP
jgi:hypothetical protein